jgi:hypothetical protein
MPLQYQRNLVLTFHFQGIIHFLKISIDLQWHAMSLAQLKLGFIFREPSFWIEGSGVQGGLGLRFTSGITFPSGINLRY